MYIYIYVPVYETYGDPKSISYCVKGWILWELFSSETETLELWWLESWAMDEEGLKRKRMKKTCWS